MIGKAGQFGAERNLSMTSIASEEKETLLKNNVWSETEK